MKLALAFIGLPAATHLALASLRQGRLAMMGIFGMAVITGLSVVLRTGAENGYSTALGMLVFSAIALAALVQVLRLMIGPGRPRWINPVTVVLAFLGAGIPMIKMLGV